jgi:hypothetical protein
VLHKDRASMSVRYKRMSAEILKGDVMYLGVRVDGMVVYKSKKSRLDEVQAAVRSR